MSDPRRDERLLRITELVRADAISSQQELADRLSADGFSVTQSAISRDLRELGIAKAGGRYVLTAGSEGADFAEVATLIRAVAPAGPNLLVLHTIIGGASRVGFELDRAAWPECVGTIAGDDTVFVATPDARRQDKVRKRLRDAMREDAHVS